MSYKEALVVVKETEEETAGVEVEVQESVAGSGTEVESDEQWSTAGEEDD